MSLKAKLKNLFYSDNSFIHFLLKCYNHIPFNNKLKARGQTSIRCSLLKKTTIKSYGKGNSIEIHSGCRFINCKIRIWGNNNHIIIHKYSSLKDVDIWVEDDNNEVEIGEHCSFEGNVHLACIEGRKIKIGKDCMFSANISIRTGDSHSVVNTEGNRINPSKDVLLGDHVWVGNTVIMTKGVQIADDCVIGSGSVVTRRFSESGCAIAGNPATVIKTDISWQRERL